MSRYETDWRQGDVLMTESALALGLIFDGADNRSAVVITHDCDLPNENEPCVEVIVTDIITAELPNPQYSYAKNPRCLHLAYKNTAREQPLILELWHSERHSIEKEKFRTEAKKDNSLTLSSDEKRILKQWLAAKYGRPAFPNVFEERLRKNKVVDKIGKILGRANTAYIIGLFFDLGENRQNELPYEEPYYMSVSVVYDSNQGGTDAREAAERVSTELRDLFENSYGKAENAMEIALDACEAVADTYFTLADLRRVDQWRLEYLSLRDGERGHFLPAGEIPA